MGMPSNANENTKRTAEWSKSEVVTWIFNQSFFQIESERNTHTIGKKGENTRLQNVTPHRGTKTQTQDQRKMITQEPTNAFSRGRRNKKKRKAQQRSFEKTNPKKTPTHTIWIQINLGRSPKWSPIVLISLSDTHRRQLWSEGKKLKVKSNQPNKQTNTPNKPNTY